MIYGFFGEMGSGKTLTMSKYAYMFYSLGYKVYTNYNLNFPHEKLTRQFLESIVKDNIDIGDKAIFCIDEIDMLIDSRMSMKKGNIIISYLLKQVRKKKIKILYTVQYEHMIDKRLRSGTKTRVLCNSKNIMIFTPTTEYMVKIIYNQFIIDGTITKKFRFVGNPFYKLYDTEELITFDES